MSPARLHRLSLLSVLLLPLPVLAYLDPVTGSFIIQGLIAGVAAVLASIRSVREKLARLLFRRRAPESARHDDAVPPAAPSATPPPSKQE